VGVIRENRTVTRGGTVQRSVFDVRNQTVSTWTGTNDAFASDADPTGGEAGAAAGNNMVQISGNVYDQGLWGGDGNLTQQTQFVDATGLNDRVTDFTYNWRDQQTNLDGPVNTHFVYSFDNLDRETLTQQNDWSSGAPVLVAQSGTAYNNRDQVYQRQLYAVAGGIAGNVLYDNFWRQFRGHNTKLLTERSGTDKLGIWRE
jgi:hypothetical protein